PGLFASPETFVRSHFAAVTSGCGSGLVRTKSSTADFRVDSSRVERSDLRGGFEPQPLQPVANLFPSRAHRSSVSTLRAGCERLTRRRSTPRLLSSSVMLERTR